MKKKRKKKEGEDEDTEKWTITKETTFTVWR